MPTTEKIQPTRAAVLAVFTESTAKEREKRAASVSPFSAFTLMGIAQELGVDLYGEDRKYVNNDYAGQMRKQLNVPALQRILDELVTEGAIIQHQGKWGVVGVQAPYGARAGTVWWYDAAHTEWAAAKARNQQREKLRTVARDQVLAAHQDEADRIYRQLCEIENLTPEEES